MAQGRGGRRDQAPPLHATATAASAAAAASAGARAAAAAAAAAGWSRRFSFRRHRRSRPPPRLPSLRPMPTRSPHACHDGNRSPPRSPASPTVLRRGSPPLRRKRPSRRLTRRVAITLAASRSFSQSLRRACQRRRSPPRRSRRRRVPMASRRSKPSMTTSRRPACTSSTLRTITRCRWAVRLWRLRRVLAC